MLCADHATLHAQLLQKPLQDVMAYQASKCDEAESVVGCLLLLHPHTDNLTSLYQSERYLMTRMKGYPAACLRWKSWRPFFAAVNLMTDTHLDTKLLQQAFIYFGPQVAQVYAQRRCFERWCHCRLQWSVQQPPDWCYMYSSRATGVQPTMEASLRLQQEKVTARLPTAVLQQYNT